MNYHVNNTFLFKKQIGSGSFGVVYSGENIFTKEDVAIKLEPKKNKPHQLKNESRTYNVLSGATGFPSLKWFGVETEYNVMVIDLLSRSLEDLFTNKCRHLFSLKTVLMLADQMIDRIQFLHSKGFIHRDIKPDNFLIGTGTNQNLIYLIDFGLTKKYVDQITNTHIPYKEGKSLTGTARYTSINTHLGIEQSRRDDLESLGYVLIYFLKGRLPWQGIVCDKREMRYQLIKEKKMSIPVEILCQGIPIEFSTYLTEVKKLGFDEMPDYAAYKRLFRDLMIREGYTYDYQYDWCENQNIFYSSPILPFITVSSAPPDDDAAFKFDKACNLYSRCKLRRPSAAAPQVTPISSFKLQTKQFTHKICAKNPLPWLKQPHVRNLSSLRQVSYY